MNTTISLILFKIEENQFALHLESVERVIHAVFITELPKSPDVIIGVINLEGEIIPVVNLRKRFNIKSKDIHPNDQFIIAHTESRVVALVVDKVGDVIEKATNEIISNNDVLPHLPFVNGLIATNDGLIVINDIDNFLSLEEEIILERALKNT